MHWLIEERHQKLIMEHPDLCMIVNLITEDYRHYREQEEAFRLEAGKYLREGDMWNCKYALENAEKEKSLAELFSDVCSKVIAICEGRGECTTCSLCRNLGRKKRKETVDNKSKWHYYCKLKNKHKICEQTFPYGACGYFERKKEI